MHNYKYPAWPAHPLRAIIVWAVAAVVVTWQFVLQLSVSAIEHELRISLRLNALELSVLASSFYYIYVIMQIPAGMLIDKFGCRKSLSYGLFICCLGCLLFSSSNSYALAIVGRVLMGGGMACAFVGAVNLAYKWFPLCYAAFLIGLVETFGMLGTFGGNMFLAQFSAQHSWQLCFQIATLISAFLGIICWLLLVDVPNGKAAIKEDLISCKQLFASLFELMKIREIWLNGIYSGILYMIITVFTGLWCLPFLMQAYSLEKTAAAFATSCVLIGVGIGAPLLGWLLGASQHHERFLACMALCACISMSLMLYVPHLNWYILILECVILGVAAGSVLICFVIAAELAPNSSVSISIGFANTLTMCTAPIVQPIIGYIFNSLTPEGSVGIIETYSVHNFRVALSILPILFFVAIFLALKLGIRNVMTESEL